MNQHSSQAMKVWRALRTPLTLIALLALLAWGARWGYERMTAPIPPAPAQPCVTQPIKDGKLRSEQVSVRILNGGSKRGLADEISEKLQDRGFKINTIGNTEERITQTVVVGLSADQPEVKLVAGYFPGATIKADPLRTDRMVEVLVGDEFKGVKADAAQAINVKVASVCLPAMPTPQ